MRHFFIVSKSWHSFSLLLLLWKETKIIAFQKRVWHLHVLVKGFTSHGGSKAGNQLPHSLVEVVQLGWRSPQLLQMQSWVLFRPLPFLSHLRFSVLLLWKKKNPKTYTAILSLKHAVELSGAASLPPHSKAPREKIYSPHHRTKSKMQNIDSDTSRQIDLMKNEIFNRCSFERNAGDIYALPCRIFATLC